jgi:hypothetical protein
MFRVLRFSLGHHVLTAFRSPTLARAGVGGRGCQRTNQGFVSDTRIKRALVAGGGGSAARAAALSSPLTGQQGDHVSCCAGTPESAMSSRGLDGFGIFL